MDVHTTKVPKMHGTSCSAQCSKCKVMGQNLLLFFRFYLTCNFDWKGWKTYFRKSCKLVKFTKIFEVNSYGILHSFQRAKDHDKLKCSQEWNHQAEGPFQPPVSFISQFYTLPPSLQKYNILKLNTASQQIPLQIEQN